MSLSFTMEGPSRVTVGTVGEPGSRVFYLQASESSTTLALKVEKQQVGALGQLLAEMLADLPTPEAVPARATLDLVSPVHPEWVVGSIQLSYDTDLARIVMLLEEASEEDPATARLNLTVGQAAALAERAEQLLEAGRPNCPLCGNPMDPEGHACPRTNGRRPRTS